MTNPLQQLRASASDIRVRIERLEKTRQQLVLARRDLEHQIRRCGDGLERVGGRSRELEVKMKMLAKNRKLILKDEKKNQQELTKLKPSRKKFG